jgi:hypothetical protein
VIEAQHGEDTELVSTGRAALPTGAMMEHIAKIGDYITVPDCATTGTVKDIRSEAGEALGSDPMLIYEIKTVHGMMRVPGDWLARLIEPA